MLHLIKKGHWSPYISFLVSAKMIYYSPNYKKFILTLKNMDFVKSLLSTKRIEWKAKFDKECIRKSRGYKGVKYTLPALRSRLQLLTYIKNRKLVWNLSELIKLNLDLLDINEQKLLLHLDKIVKKRKQNFNISEKNKSVKLLDKITKSILLSLKTI